MRQTQNNNIKNVFENMHYRIKNAYQERKINALIDSSKQSQFQEGKSTIKLEAWCIFDLSRKS